MTTVLALPAVAVTLCILAVAPRSVWHWPLRPQERPVSGRLSLPGGLPDVEAAGWADRASDHIATMPPKAKKPRK